MPLKLHSPPPSPRSRTTTPNNTANPPTQLNEVSPNATCTIPLSTFCASIKPHRDLAKADIRQENAIRREAEDKELLGRRGWLRRGRRKRKGWVERGLWRVEEGVRRCREMVEEGRAKLASMRSPSNGSETVVAGEAGPAEAEMALFQPVPEEEVEEREES
ncbi:hypothetical protein ACLMJK_005154 [Lecanora helva]